MLKSLPARAGAALAVLCALPVLAHAQLAAPAETGMINMLGDSTAGSETGIYELQAMVAAAIAVFVAVFFIGLAWKVFRRTGNRA